MKRHKPSFCNWIVSNYQMEARVIFHFKPSGLRCEMTVMPLDRVLGRDRVVLEVIPNLDVGFCY